LITSLQRAENVPLLLLLFKVAVPVAQNVPPLTVAVGDELTVHCDVAVPLHGAVTKTISHSIVFPVLMQPGRYTVLY
jgi:hypothetical protein